MARTDSIDADDVLMPLQAASSTYRIAFGPRAGRKVLSLQYAPRRAAPVTPQLCANAHGPSAGSGQALTCMQGCAVMPINAVSLNNCAATSRARLLFTIGQRTVECEPRGASDAQAQDTLPQRHYTHCDVADGVHATARRTGAAPALTLDTLSWGAGAECEIAFGGGAGAGAEYNGGRR